MNTKQIQRFVTKYMEATQCEILEKSNYHMKVKLSPAADRELTNRPYYWSFIDRMNEQPETMSFLFVFDEEKYDAFAAAEQLHQPQAEHTNDQLLNKAIERSYGIAPKPIKRVPREHLHFGSSRLQQLFSSAQANGGYVYLFEEPPVRSLHPYASRPYTVWLGINYLIEFSSDRKREEIHSLGISLVTGHCQEHFVNKLNDIRLSPRIPANIHITKNGIPYTKALSIAEAFIAKKLKSYSYDWAEQAHTQLDEELERLSSFYQPMIQQATEEQRNEVIKLKEKREEEIKWQYEPRITVSVINCGLFHLDGID